MLKLLTRKDLWVAIAFSACFWFGLPKVAPALAKYSAPFAGLVLLLSLLSLILGQIEQEEDKGKAMDEAKAQEGDSLHSALATQNEAQRKLQEELAALRQDIKSIKGTSAPPANESLPALEAPAKLGELSGALSEAMKQISSRDGQIDLLTKNVNQSNIQRNLVRLTQTLEFSLSLHKRIVTGQSDPAESMQFIVDDLESALAANGVEHLVIMPGTKIPELKAGSFIPVTVVEAPSPELKGTVKEVRTRAYYINEENRPRFISPAKVVLYKA
jgi:uncharacterized coiled-coil protein SlyX